MLNRGMNHESNLAELFSSVRGEVQRGEFEKRNESRLNEGKSKAKEWIPCNDAKPKEVLAAIKLYKASTIKKKVYTFPLNPWYFVTDLGYVYRLCQWDKVLNKEERANGESSLRWQLCCDGKHKSHKIYIGRDNIETAKQFGYKVHTQKDAKGLIHHSININNALLIESCQQKGLTQFVDKRSRRLKLVDEQGVEYTFDSQKECYEKLFADVVSYITFKRAMKNAQDVLKIKSQCYKIISFEK